MWNVEFKSLGHSVRGLSRLQFLDSKFQIPNSKFSYSTFPHYGLLNRTRLLGSVPIDSETSLLFSAI